MVLLELVQKSDETYKKSAVAQHWVALTMVVQNTLICTKKCQHNSITTNINTERASFFP